MSIKPRTAEVVIYHGDDLVTIADLKKKADMAQARFDAAKASGSSRMGGEEDPEISLTAYKDFVNEAADRATIVTIQDIGYAHKELKWEHEPRKVTAIIDGETTEATHESDDQYGVNTTTYPMAVLMFADPEDEDLRTIVSPTFAGEAALRKFLRRLPEGDFDKLWLSAFYLNGEMATDPKAMLFLDEIRHSSAPSA